MKYKPLKNGDVLDVSAVLNQATQLLDIASIIAVEDGNIKGILKLYREWVELAGMTEDELEVVDISEISEPYGFHMDRKEDHGED